MIEMFCTDLMMQNQSCICNSSFRNVTDRKYNYLKIAMYFSDMEETLRIRKQIGTISNITRSNYM